MAIKNQTEVQYMQRCIELASKGAGNVAPNPMVGAVLVYDDKIIGEGWHQQYGEAHAEVNCINDAIRNGCRENISKATLYVSLEPCNHFGKTPPCTDLILENKISNVVIGCTDPFKEVNGKGIARLKKAGVAVKTGVLEDACKSLNKRFFLFHTQHRPFIILKWAETANGKISQGASQRLLISNEYSNRLVHKWRSMEAAILVGTNTVLLDDPELTNRLWPGHTPIRLVVDMELKLSLSHKVFNSKAPVIVFNSKQYDIPGEWFTFTNWSGIKLYKVTKGVSLVHQITHALYQLNIQSVIVEGGARLIQSFIDEGIWDEARVIQNEELLVENGLDAPVLSGHSKISGQKIITDNLQIYKRIEA
jgi:diaminohydroxyphosphoribosylaminopyrimidine deaminase/5-amino-6-(5-phosphoribosylamino)uracil reductase